MKQKVYRKLLSESKQAYQNEPSNRSSSSFVVKCKLQIKRVNKSDEIKGPINYMDDGKLILFSSSLIN